MILFIQIWSGINHSATCRIITSRSI